MSSVWIILLLLARRLFIGVVLAYAFTSLILGGTSCARPVFQALTACWSCILLAAAYRSYHGKPVNPGPLAAARGFRTLELVTGNLALALVLGEISLRLYLHLEGDSIFLSDSLEAYKLVPGRDYGAGLHGNRLGYPGREFTSQKEPGIYRIAALGDSFAVGPAVPFADNFLKLLENHLPGTEVYNFGVSGTGPREYHAILQRDVWPWQPDLVLVCVFVGNDITETLATPRHLDPRQHALCLLLERGWRLASEGWRPREAAPAVEGRLAGGLSETTFREVEARRLAICLTDKAPSLEKKWQQALGYLERIFKDCRQRRVPAAVVLIPDEFQVNPLVREEAMRDAGVRTVEVDLDLPQRRLRLFCIEQGVPCLDLQPAFALKPGTYAPRDTHWNVQGNRLAAAHISKWLKELLPGARLQSER